MIGLSLFSHQTKETLGKKKALLEFFSSQTKSLVPQSFKNAIKISDFNIFLFNSEIKPSDFALF